jgi:glycosyltransferase involved in cell wall biosynthesis
MPPSTQPIRIALAINSIAPSRYALYSALAEQFTLLILHGGMESNRKAWMSSTQGVRGAIIKRLQGWQLRFPRKEGGKVVDHRHIHLNPDLLLELIKFSPDAVITNEMGMRTMTALLYGMFFRKPVWIWWGGTLHSERVIGTNRKLVRSVVKRLARHWISYGHTSTEYLLSLGIPAARVLQIQNSVDESQFESPAHDAEFNVARRPAILCVGQLIARKGIHLLLDAAAAVQQQGEEFSLMFVGDGPDKAALQAQVASLGLRNVEFHSGRSPEKMRAVYASADSLVFPTLEDVWGLVANEAILSGLPVLCSKYAGCAIELFPPEYIVDVHNPSDFAAKLRSLVCGEIKAVDPQCLLTTHENAQRISSAIRGTLRTSEAQPESGVEGSRAAQS